MRPAVSIVYTLVLGASAIIQSPPRISKQPPTNEQLFQVAQTKVNENDKPFLIECEAEGEPVPTTFYLFFEWPAYDRISQQPGRGTLMISRPRDKDVGQYQCFAENKWGIATSNSVFVRKAELNSFKEPITVEAPKGAPFKLTCQPPKGWPKPNVYWETKNIAGDIKSINNSRMTVDPEGNLWFSNVTRGDAKTYACATTSVFTNEYIVGNKVLLNVLSTSASTGQKEHFPTKRFVTWKNWFSLRGKNVPLVPSRRPFPYLNIHPFEKRYVTKVPLVPSKRPSPYLNTHPVEKQYVTKVPLVPSRRPSPYLNTHPVEKQYVTKVPLVPSRRPSPYLNTHPVEKQYVTKVPLVPSRRPFPYLNTHPVEKQYVTKVPLVPSRRPSPYLNTHSVEKQYVSQKNQVGLRGKEVELFCIFGGTPLPRIVWSKNGKLIKPTDRVTQRNYGKSLVIKHVSFEDEGKYTCEASNGVRTAETYSINLQVMAVPYFTVEPKFVSAAENETIEIRCAASGVPIPEIKWTYNGKPISEAPKNSRRKVTPNSIIIKRLVKKDTGNYGCNATNSLGYVYKDIYVNVLALYPNIKQRTNLSNALQSNYYLISFIIITLSNIKLINDLIL